MKKSKQIIPVLTIAGSDSCGGAGIQADIKTFSALGLYACSAITAVTAQNTLSVKDVFALSASIVSSQIDTVLEDLPIKAIKIGMLFNEEIIKAVADSIKRNNIQSNLVLDPVMISTSGSVLLQKQAQQVMIETLFPLVDIITPNLIEAANLANLKSITSIEQVKEVALYIQKELSAKRVLIKGGHFNHNNSIDVFLDIDGRFYEYSSERIESKNTHGTGCSLSSAIASYLALGYDYKDSIKLAKDYIFSAIKESKDIFSGNGNGSLNHFFNPHKLILK